MNDKEHDEEYDDKEYFECMAKLILKDLIPNKTKNLISSDRPDLQDYENSFGVEVTRALKEEIGEFQSLQFKSYIEDTKKKSKISKKYLENKGYNVGINYLELDCDNISISCQNSFNLIFKSFKEKVKKLQTYDKFDTNALFIFSSIHKREIDGNKILDEFKNLQSDFEYKFDYIYICTLSKFYVFNMKDFKYEIIEVDEQQKSYYSNKAKEELDALNNK